MRQRALAFGALLVLACRVPVPSPVSVPDPRPAPRWPQTVAEAVEARLHSMSESEKSAIRGVSRERVQDMYHGFQMLHRAEFGLLEGNDALLASCGSVRMPAEDCMRVILDALWLALNGNAGPTR